MPWPNRGHLHLNFIGSSGFVLWAERRKHASDHQTFSTQLQGDGFCKRLPALDARNQCRSGQAFERERGNASTM